jgi:hypothetical protein
MASEIRRADYFYTMVPDKPGEAACILAGLRDASISLLAFCGFPQGRKGQLDFVVADSAAFVKAARKMKIKLSKKKTAFLVSGDDQVGAAAEFMEKLAAAKINVVSMQGISAGIGRFGAILWVKPADIKKAAKALGIA